ncbi:MAG: RNA-binding cell elongation regulator Jag/EloR [Eubacteriales bacterium]|nr:RNA-binding cell elongation regulator Jag/EloR [Eubacteriales bacterium]
MITVSAKTLDEAITKALLELQTTSDHLHYEVIQKESSGILGIFGVKPCIIRARVMSEEEEKALKKAAADKERAAKAAEREAAKAASKPVEKAPVKAEEKKAEKPAAKPAVKPAERVSEKPAAEVKSDRPAGRPAAKNFEKRDSGRREGRRDFDRKKEQPKREERPAAAEEAAPAPKAKAPVNVDVEKVQKDAKEFLVQVFGAMGMEVTIETAFDEAEGELQVMMAGDDMGILIGKRGQTLDSLQYLVSLVVNKETEGYLRVKLDTENYRERRKETLETLAKNISYKVKRTKRPVSLEPMNPYERRIIHSALQNDRYVTTRSEGEDPYRHVVISLKKEAYAGGGRKDRYPARRDNRNRDRRPGEKNFDRGERSAERSAERNAERSAERSIERNVERAPKAAENPAE